MHAFLTAHSCSLAHILRECKCCHLAILENSVDLLIKSLYFFLGRCARGFKTLPLSPSSTCSMLGKQGLLGIPSAPPKLFCLSGLATSLEYICAEDYSRTGRLYLFLPVNTQYRWTWPRRTGSQSNRIKSVYTFYILRTALSISPESSLLLASYF